MLEKTDNMEVIW